MKRLIYAIIMAIFFFTLLNFIYCNLDETVFSYPLVFKFYIPYIIELHSVPLPLGFVLLLSFCAGMLAIAMLEAFPSLFKTMELRSKNKKIKQLEREINMMRSLSKKDDANPSFPSGSGESS